MLITPRREVTAQSARTHRGEGSRTLTVEHRRIPLARPSPLPLPRPNVRATARPNTSHLLRAAPKKHPGAPAKPRHQPWTRLANPAARGQTPRRVHAGHPSAGARGDIRVPLRRAATRARSPGPRHGRAPSHGPRLRRKSRAQSVLATRLNVLRRPAQAPRLETRPLAPRSGQAAPPPRHAARQLFVGRLPAGHGSRRIPLHGNPVAHEPPRQSPQRRDCPQQKSGSVSY